MWLRITCLLALTALLGFAVRGAAQPAKGKKYALLVGVTEYDHASLGPLKYTENDVEELAAVLTRPGVGFTSVRVLTMTRGKKDAKAKPTKANIDKAIGELLDGVKRDDTVLIALAGHGVQLEVADPEEKKPSNTYAYFCPTDAHFRSISHSTGTSPKMILVTNLLKDLASCGAGTKLILVDACRNELKADSATRSFDTGEVRLSKGMAAMFSCKPGEKAWESGKLGKRGGHGVFFHSVIEGLKGEAKNKKGEITWSGLSEYVSTSVSERVPTLIGDGANQTPHATQNFFGGSPVLMSPAKIPIVVKTREPKPGEYVAHEGGVRCLAVSPNGKILASAGSDGVVKLWELPSMKPLRDLKGHKGNVYRIAFHPKGDRLATAGGDKTVRIWKLDAGEEERVLTGHTEVVGGVTYSLDGKQLVSTGGDKTVRFWDAANGKPLGSVTAHESYVYIVEVSPDGTRYATASSDKTIKLFSAADRKEVLTISGHEKSVARLAFSPDGTRLASTSLDKSVRTWNPRTGQALGNFMPEQGEASWLCFSRDGKSLALSHYSGAVSVVNVGTEKTTFAKKMNTLVFCVVFSPGQKSLIAGLNAAKGEMAKIVVTPIE